MSNFLYLFRGGDKNMQSLSQEEKELHMVAWQKWMGKLSQEGKLLDGLPLSKDGKVVENKGEVIITDGPYAEGAELVGGYLIVSATNLEEATAISTECPILKYENGTVEVREMLSLNI